MPLIWGNPFPNENARDPVETFRTARLMWQRAQKFRAGQFAWTKTFPAATIIRATFTDPADPGVDNLVAGMFVAVTPPSSINASLQVDYAFSPANGQLTIQVRNSTGADIAVSGVWSYLGYTF